MFTCTGSYTTVPVHPQRKLYFRSLPSDNAGSQSSEDPGDLRVENPLEGEKGNKGIEGEKGRRELREREEGGRRKGGREGGRRKRGREGE